jgi:phosphoribosyl 1,2-cyclic phosphate phosphodiesterase
MNITFLGTGTSHGVPPIECMLAHYERCPTGVCRKSLTDPRYRRTRSSILVENESRRILVDVSSDFREQALREQVPSIDAVLITHAHSDHISGIPDIRSYAKDAARPLPLYGSLESMDAIRESFPYIFNPNAVVGGGIPRIALNPVDAPFDLYGLRITPVPVTHGGARQCYGYRIGDTAYIPDMKSISPAAQESLQYLDCLILNCLRPEREHSTHMILSQSLSLARALNPERCYFIHMSHDIDYERHSALLDDRMAFSHDGLSIKAA